VKKTTIERDARAPEILLALNDELTVGGTRLAKGDALFVPGSTGTYAIEGNGFLYRATTNTD